MKKIIPILILTFLVTSCHQKDADKAFHPLSAINLENMPKSKQSLDLSSNIQFEKISLAAKSQNESSSAVDKFEKHEVNKKQKIKDGRLGLEVTELQKTIFKLFDFFANCEFFEEKFNYDESIKLPSKGSTGEGTGAGNYTNPAPYFKNYFFNTELRDIIENKKYLLLNTNPNGDVFRKLAPELCFVIPEYLNDNVSLNKLVA
jgi:hypothetical protein